MHCQRIRAVGRPQSIFIFQESVNDTNCGAPIAFHSFSFLEAGPVTLPRLQEMPVHIDMRRLFVYCRIDENIGNTICAYDLWYTDKENNIAVSADWCNGNVAMTGGSYGGTLPFEVATTGVEGLKTIIPVAGISSWYDYANSQGVSTYSEPHYTDILAGLVAGATYLDDEWLVTNDKYGAWLKQIAADETKANGNYTDIWKKMDYTLDADKIKCSALIVHGLNDFNRGWKEIPHPLQVEG